MACFCAAGRTPAWNGEVMTGFSVSLSCFTNHVRMGSKQQLFDGSLAK